MPELINDRVCAEADGDIVLFLIGMRLNRPWKFWKFLPVLRAMPRMIAELTRNPALGLLHARGHYGPRNLMMPAILAIRRPPAGLCQGGGQTTSPRLAGF